MKGLGTAGILPESHETLNTGKIYPGLLVQGCPTDGHLLARAVARVVAGMSRPVAGLVAD